MSEPIYYTNGGPLDGPLLSRDDPAFLSILVKPKPKRPAPAPIGTAISAGWIEGPRAHVAIFRLIVGKKELPGRYVCAGRRFVEAEQWFAAHGRGDATAPLP